VAELLDTIDVHELAEWRALEAVRVEEARAASARPVAHDDLEDHSVFEESGEQKVSGLRAMIQGARGG
jgi:hypothetical protein